MTRARPWQFSIRTMVLLVLLTGPLIGAFTGTFGRPVQQVLIMMAVVFSISIALAVLSTLLAFVLLSPLLFMEKFFRDSRHRGIPLHRNPVAAEKESHAESE